MYYNTLRYIAIKTNRENNKYKYLTVMKFLIIIIIKYLQLFLCGILTNEPYL